MTQNGTLMQYFHWYYGDSVKDPDLWDKVKREAKKLAANGVTALWLPPAYKGIGGARDVGYGIYDLYDLGEFNQKGSVRTKYGTKKQFLNAIKAAHEYGMQVYADVVFNHKAGADETEWVKALRVDYYNRNFSIGEEVWIEAFTKFTFPGRKGKYSDLHWHYRHFDGVDWANNLQESAIFKFSGRGKNWAEMVDKGNGNFDYLMFSDLDMNHPEVRTELANWAKWFINNTDIDGFRIDAVKHIQFSFFREWLTDIRRVFPKKELFAVGEYWSDNLDSLQFYIEKTAYTLSLFDAPLQRNFYDASRSPNGAYDMRKILDNTLVQRNPTKAVTIVDNHDTQPCQSLERWVDFWFKPLAYAIILLREGGYPCVFYPDYYGAAYFDKGLVIDLEPVPKLQSMMVARKLYAYGPQHDYFDHQHIVGWSREGVDEFSGSGIAVVLSNADGGSKWMDVGVRHANATFYDYLGNHAASVTINDKGWGDFPVTGGSVSAWVRR